jgi:hypothetical protein
VAERLLIWVEFLVLGLLYGFGWVEPCVCFGMCSIIVLMAGYCEELCADLGCVLKSLWVGSSYKDDWSFVPCCVLTE